MLVEFQKNILILVMIFFVITNCSLIKKKQPYSQILVTIDSNGLNEMSYNDKQFQLIFLSKNYILQEALANDINNLAELEITDYSKPNKYKVSSYYNYFIIPKNIIKESLILNRDTKKIILILKDKTRILSKKTIDFNCKNFKVLNFKINNSSVTVN